MKLETLTVYRIDGETFDSVKKARAHIEDRIFKHVQAGTAYAGAGSEQSKMRLDLTAHILKHRAELADLLSADFSESDND